MTVSTTSNKTAAQVMGAATYSFNFRVITRDPGLDEAKQAIKCEVRDADGNHWALTYGTDYSVTLNENGYGGTVTVTDVLDSSHSIVIYREYDVTQGSDYENYNTLPASTIEDNFDKLTMTVQQIDEKTERALFLPITARGDIKLEFPEPIAKRALKWNATATNLENSKYDLDEVTDITVAAKDDAVSAKNDAEGYATTAANAKDGILNDAGFIAVSADLTGSNNIGTVATDLSGSDTIGTVAANIADVNAVGSNIAKVTAVADNETNINAVNSNKTNIDTVAGSIADVNAVGADIANVSAVAADLTNIDAVNANKTNINIVAAFDPTKLDAVADDIASINAVAGDLTNIDAVNANKTNIDSVAGNETNINAVAGNATNINTVAGDTSNIDAVAGNATNINAVNANKTNIDIVANNIATINEKAPINSPTFTGTPTAPTPTSATDSSTKIATTEWVAGHRCKTAATTTSTASVNAPAYVTENYCNSSNGDWYRVWSDGWIEQGGIVEAGNEGTKTITFPKAFATTKYNIQKTMGSSNSSSSPRYAHVSFWDLTTTNAKTQNTGNNVGYWFACGY